MTAKPRGWLVIGVVLAVLWLFVRGVDLAVDAIIGQSLLGLAVGLPIAFVFRRLYAPRFNLGSIAGAVKPALLYLGAFTRELVVANIDVTYRVIAPSLPIYPDVIAIPLRVRTDVAITLIANSITITPGTITMDYDPVENELYVHVIDIRDPEKIMQPIRTWENYALLMFDEELSPDDPAEPITIVGDEYDGE